jgi:glucose-1-phosphatase
MSAQGIRAVVFDLGGVLINFDFGRANRRISALTGVPPDDVRRRLLSCQAFLDFECGRISEREFHACVEKVIECRIPFAEFHDIWNCIFAEEIESTVALIAPLRQRVKVGLLSNTNVLHFDFLKTRMPVLKELDRVFTSHEIGCRKPDAKAYEHVLKEMNVRAAESVFVDDLMENVAAARQVGMHGIHATDPASVAAGLRDLGVLK